MLSNSSRSDLVRRLGTTLAGVVAVLGALVGGGLIGTPIAEAGGGALSSAATLLAPAGPAFAIWSVIYVGLVGFVIWQWLPAAVERTRRTGWLPAASMLLNAGWILAAQTGLIWLTAVIIVALLIILAWLLTRLAGSSSGAVVETVLVDGTFGLYLGWVSVATCANLAAALVAGGVRLDAAPAAVVAVIVIAVAALVGVLTAWRWRGRLAVAVSLAWGLGWIAVGRWTGEPASPAVAVAAGAAVIIVLGSWALFRWRAGSSGARAR